MADYLAFGAETDEDDDLLEVTDLCRMFEESEESTYEARKNAERDRDYVDNKQHTAEEIAVLEKRGQPIVTDNRIKTKIDFLVGLEKTQRIDPRALPRTPAHEEDADGATQALIYVADTNDYDTKRSGVWRNMLVEGAGGIRVYVEPSKKGYGAGGMMGSTALTQPEYDIKIDRVPWDRMFWDPHSAEPDFEDAGYKGLVVWSDYADAIKKYPDEKSREALETTLNSAPSDTYDDKPKFNLWADRKRKRVRICQIWIRRNDEWHFAEFTKGGILKGGPSPYKTDTGESDCELFFQSAFVDRDNNRYGYVREMVSPQDEVNKRRSKSLHLLTSNQTMYEEGAVPDIEAFRREKAKPDGTMKVAPGALAGKKIITETRTDLAEGHFKLLVESQNAIDLKGPNATMLGDKAQGSSAASGKAIIASQKGGMISLGDLTDNLQHLDKRVFTAIWNRIRQFWTAEKWIRTTDDERNVKWVGMNVDRQQINMAMQQNPEMQEKIAGAVGNVAELDCDIIIDEAPDTLTPQLEQFQALVELKKMDPNGEIPFRAVVEAIPNLKNRSKFLEHMDEKAKQPPAPPPEIVKAQVDAKAAAEKATQAAELAQQQAANDAQLANERQQNETLLARQKAADEAAIARQKAQDEMELRRWVAAQEIEIKRDVAETNAAIAARQAEREPAQSN
jgi:hypothetical protein